MTTDRLLSSVRGIADRSHCRPALAAAVIFALGIASCRAIPAHPAYWIVGVGLAMASALAWRGRVIVEESCLAVALILAGLAAGQLALYYFPSDDVGLRARQEPRPIQVEVVILDVPRLGMSANPHLPPRQSFTAAVLHVFQQGRWVRASGNVTVTVARPADGLSIGQHLRLTGLISLTRPANNPGQFDSSAFYRSQRLLAALTVPHASGVQFIDGPALLSKWWAWVERARSRARDALSVGFTASHVPDQRLLGALVFADRPPEMQSQVELFQRAGLLHLLSSNGTRIALLVGVIFVLGRMLGLSPRRHLSATILIIFVAAWLVQPAPQVLRPALVGAAMTFALFCRRNVDGVQLVALVALALLLNDPLDFFAAGFQLSFVIVLGLALLARPLIAALEALDAQDRRMDRQLAQRRKPATFRQAVAARVSPYAMDSLKFGIGAWLIATPLVMYHFEQCNLWSAPLGCLLAPLVALTMLAGFFKVLMTLVLPWGAPLWATIAGWFPALLRHVIELAARVPGSNVPTSSPSIIWIVAWYAALGVVLFYLRRRAAIAANPKKNADEIVLPDASALAQVESLEVAPSREIEPGEISSQTAPRLSSSRARWERLSRSLHAAHRWAMPVASLVPLLACVLWLFHPLNARAVGGRADDGELRLTLLSIGAGQCAVMQVPGGEIDCFDAGSESIADPWQACLAPFLRHLGRSRADRVFLSHGDFDHISAVPAMLPHDAPGEIDLSPHLRRCAPRGDFADRMLNQLKLAHVPTRLIWADQSIGPQPLGSGGATIEVLWPPAHCEMNSNNTGLVLRVSYAGRSILFPADIQEPAERALLQRPPGFLRADVLVAPHHGSSEAATADFVAAVAPRFIVSSNGARLTHKQRTFDEIVKYVPLYRTSRCGAITVRITRDGTLDVQTFGDQPHAGNPSAEYEDEDVSADFDSGD